MVSTPDYVRAALPGIKPDIRPVVRVALRSTRHSEGNRRRARELAWQWVASKWPRLLPTSDEMELRQFSRSVAGQRLVASTDATHSSWTLAVAFDERHGSRTWMTQIEVADGGDADLLNLQTACTEQPDAPLVIAPPSLLGTWAERLALEDGPFAVLGVPREVNDAEQLEAFVTHVLSAHRKLPVIALTNRPGTRFYGVDPHGLATAVRAMAHVACLAPEVAAEVADRLGPHLGVVPGAARIYGAGRAIVASRYDHPLIRDNTGIGNQTRNAGAFRRLMCQKICAMSVREQADAASPAPHP